MRLLFSVAGLLVTLLLVMWLVKTQLQGIAPRSAAGASAASSQAGMITPQQYKQQLDRAMGASHPTAQEGQ
ncbi:hypothetical protein GALL_406600 [mine drainage metagenome]|uniref:Uncharacterized protein n=1 Tax=mine drainage metagenome TaxID=410659 RepID=A0A1J5QCK7_9ZZZZ